MFIEEISRAIRQFAPDYGGNCVNDEPQALFDGIRCLVRTDGARFRPGMAHRALLEIVNRIARRPATAMEDWRRLNRLSG